MKKLRYLITGAAVLFVILVLTMVVLDKAGKGSKDLPRLYKVPEFNFMESSGKPFGISNFSGKISVVDFIFTRCGGPCPLMAKSMGELYDAFARSNRVQLISITVDPAYDSLKVLRAYAQELGVTDNRWKFVRGEKPELMELYEKGFKLSGNLPYEHSTKLVLVDEQGWIRGYYDYDDPIAMNLLKQHIAILVKSLDEN